LGIDKVLVARAEDRKVSGQKHMETVRALDEETGVVFERLPPEKLLDQTTKKVDESKWYEALSARFERPERSSFVIEELLRWEREGRPQDRPPLATNRKDGEAADKIGKIRVIATGSKPAVRVRGGTADRGDMARVDVFSKVNAKGKKQFFLVPIYPHQVAGDENPPNRAVAANTPEENWPELDSSFGFEFSIVQKSWIEAIKTDGTVIEGYFRGMDRGTGAVNISPHITNSTLVGRPGAKTLLSFAKYTSTA